MPVVVCTSLPAGRAAFGTGHEPRRPLVAFTYGWGVDCGGFQPRRVKAKLSSPTPPPFFFFLSLESDKIELEF